MLDKGKKIKKKEDQHTEWATSYITVSTINPKEAPVTTMNHHVKNNMNKECSERENSKQQNNITTNFQTVSALHRVNNSYNQPKQRSVNNRYN